MPVLLSFVHLLFDVALVNWVYSWKRSWQDSVTLPYSVTWYVTDFCFRNV